MIRKYSFIVLMIVFCSCEKIKISTPPINTLYLINKVTDVKDNLIAEYTYNEFNQLIRKDIYTPGARNAHTFYLYTYYKDGTLHIMDCTDLTFSNLSYEFHYYYNEKKQVVKREHYKNKILFNTMEYKYDEHGRLVSCTSNGNKWGDFEYDNRGNVINETYYVEHIDGELEPEIIDFKFDHLKKVSDGLNYIPRTDLIPVLSHYRTYAESLSANNVTEHSKSESLYTYQYDENGYPIEITQDDKTYGLQTVKINYIALEDKSAK